MVGGQNKFDILRSQRFHQFEERAVLEPRFGNASIRLFVGGKFANHLRVGAGMRQHIYKVDNQHRKLVAKNLVKVIGEFLAFFGIVNFIVEERRLHPHSIHLFLKQFAFKIIFCALLVFVHPKVGVQFLDFRRHKTCKHRVTRELRGCGQNAEQNVLIINIIVVGNHRFDALPLVEAQVVDNHHNHLLASA